MATVLVTGSSGFLGGTVVPRLLASGHRVVGLDPAPPPASAPYRSVIDDLTDGSRLERLLNDEQITHVIHSGGVSGAMVMPDRPDRLMAINVGGSCNLLQAALAARIKTFLYCSSVSAFGPYYETQPIPADYRSAPTDPYGCSKAAVDFMLRGIWGRVALDICSLRFVAIYGPGRRTSNVIDGIADAALAGKSIRLPRQADYPFVYIDDAADAAVAACLSDRRCELIYNIAYPEQVTLDDLVDAVALHAPRVTLEIDESKVGDPRGPVDITTSARDFDFHPKIDHREGVRRVIEAKRRDRSGRPD
jgi:UDP-glucuronate 4-epimerase